MTIARDEKQIMVFIALKKSSMFGQAQPADDFSCIVLESIMLGWIYHVTQESLTHLLVVTVH